MGRAQRNPSSTRNHAARGDGLTSVAVESCCALQPAIMRPGVLGFASLYPSYEKRIQNSRSSHAAAAATSAPPSTPNTVNATTTRTQDKIIRARQSDVKGKRGPVGVDIEGNRYNKTK